MLYLILEFGYLSFQLLLSVQQVLTAVMGAVAIGKCLLHSIHYLRHQIHKPVKNCPLADGQQTHSSLADHQEANGLHRNTGAAAASKG